MGECRELKEAMGAADKTVAEVARLSRVSERNLYLWRREGCARPQEREVNRVAEVIYVDPSDLRGWLVAAAQRNAAYASSQPSALSLRGSEATPTVSDAVAMAMTMPESTRLLFIEQQCPWSDADAVAELARMTGASLETLYASHGGLTLCDIGVAIHQRATSWLGQSSGSHEVTRALEMFCGELAIWIGWIALDAGRVDTAIAFLHEAMLHARIAGCVQTEICALNNISVLHVRTGSPSRARKMAEVALRLGQKQSSLLRSLLHLRSAVASGHMGNSRSFSANIERARMEFERNTGPSSPTWFRSFSEGEVTGLIGWGQLALGKGAAAEESFRSTLAGLDQSARRARVHYEIQLARAMAAQGAECDAADLGAGIITDVRSIQSNAVRQDLRELYGALSLSRSTRAKDFSAIYSDYSRELSPFG